MINTGLVIFIVNFDLIYVDIPYFPIFTGSYQEFTVAWYKATGATICLTMIINIIGPHMGNAVIFFFIGYRRCRDRGCTRDDKKSKLFVQSEYENLNTGP